MLTLKDKNRLVWTLTSILLFAGMSSDIYVPSLPHITEVFGATPELAGYTLSVYIVSASVSGLLASVISDRIGRKPSLLAANVVFMAATLSIVFSPSIYFFIFARMVQGLAAGFYWIVTRQIIKDLLTEKEQINANSIMFTAYVLSPALAPVLGAYIANLFTWRACFVFIFVLQLLVFRGIKNRFRESIDERKALPLPHVFIGTFFKFFLHREFNAAVLVSSLSYGGYFAYVAISSFVFISRLGFSKISYSMIFIILSAVYLAGNYMTRFLNNRNYSKHRIIIYGASMNFTGGAILCLCFFTDNIHFISTVIIVSAVFKRFGLGFMLSLVQVVAMNVFERNGGQALGTVNTLQSVSAGLAAYLVTQYTDSVFGLFMISFTFTLGALLSCALFQSKTILPRR